MFKWGLTEILQELLPMLMLMLIGDVVAAPAPELVMLDIAMLIVEVPISMLK
jgi:hypothetical protein